MEKSLTTTLEVIAKKYPYSRIGACVKRADAEEIHCLNGYSRFSMQSVVKLLVGAATFDAIERGLITLDQPVTLTHEDMSVFEHPLAQLIAQNGTYTTTIRDMIARSINDSDNAACDKLISLLGGPASVQAFLDKKGVSDMRVDRDEKHLQSNIAGLEWQETYTDPKAFSAAMKSVPPQEQEKAYHAYQTDIRDTSTPRGMVRLLQRLADHTLLSPQSSEKLIEIMSATRTGTDRLRASLGKGWALANKTGTSTTLNGLSAATNDVGLMTTPDGKKILVAVFVADSSAPTEDRAAIIADIGAAVVQHYDR